MFRCSLRISSLPLRKAIRYGVFPKVSRRYQSSTSSGKSGAGKAIITVGTFAIGVVGGTIAYAGFDPKFRTFVQGTIPISEGILKTILGPEETDIEKQYPSLKKSRKMAEDSEKLALSSYQKEAGLLQKKIEREAKKAELKILSESKEAAQSSEADTSELEKFKTQIYKLQTQMKENLDDVLGAFDDAHVATKEYMSKVSEALEKLSDLGPDNFENVLKKSNEMKNNSVKLAQAKGEEMRKLAEELRGVIKDGYESESAKDHPVLSEANTFLLKTMERIDQTTSKLSTVAAEAEFSSKYHGAMQRWLDDLKREVQAIHPDVSLGGSTADMSPLEFNILISHAYQKVCQLMKELARLESQSFQHQSQEGVDVSHMISEERMKAELDRLRRDMEAETHRKISSLREEAECQLRLQLRHQASAHADHLQDALRVQGMELERRWNGLLEDEVRAEKMNYYQVLAALISRARGLDEAIKSRAQLDDNWRRSQSLWGACAALLYKLKASHRQSCTWEEKIRCVKREVDDCIEVAGPGNEFVQIVAEAIPCEATDRGVFPEDALKERFIHVDKMCRRVALVGENGGGLIRFCLSYIQSLLVIRAFDRLPSREACDLPVYMDNFTTFDILNRAKYCLDKDDLPQAVRYMSLLEGAPKIVAKDWLCEARLNLETRLAAEALVAWAASIGVQASS